MLAKLSRWVMFFAFVTLATAQTAQPAPSRSGGDFAVAPATPNKVPQGVLLIKGAWYSASDSVTPVPEGGSVTNNVFNNAYFGISYALPPGWEQKYEGPPPSDNGRYVLAQLRPVDSFKGVRASILISAEDMFFTPLPADNALQLVHYSTGHLQADYKIEMPPTPTKIAGRPFTFYAYWSPIAELHWYVMATDIRCHAVQIIASSRDTKLLENLVLDLNRMKIPAEGQPTSPAGDPVCIKDYARDENMINRVEPVFSEHRFNSVPVRIIIDKQGDIKHIHFLSAFPDQEKAITTAMHQWKFKPYLQNGKPVEVETGIMFGRALRPRVAPAGSVKTTD
jgi:hypothetical protein